MPDGPDRIEGTVTTYFEEQGYGFLTTVDINDGGSTDVFFHITEVYDYERVEEKWRLECTPNYSHEEGGWEGLEAEVISKETTRGAVKSRREPWYRRESASEANERVDGYGEEVMERKQSRDESSDDDGGVRYDPSDHV